MVTRIRWFTALLPLTATALALTGCGASSKIELSSDWSHVIGYAVASVNDHAVVVGIDPTTATARPLAEVPIAPEADTVLADLVGRGAHGETIVSQPTTSGGAVAYRVTKNSATLERVGVQPGGGSAYARRGGWVDTASHGAVTRVIVRNPGFATTASFTVAAPSQIVATDGDHTLCLAGARHHRTVVTTVDLNTRRIVATSYAPAHAYGLACIRGRSLVGYVGRRTARVAVTSAGGALTVSFPRGYPEVMLTDGAAVIATVMKGQGHVVIDRVSLVTRKVTTLGTIDDFGPVEDAFISGHTLVMVSDDQAATFDLVGREQQAFPLLP